MIYFFKTIKTGLVLLLLAVILFGCIAGLKPSVVEEEGGGELDALPEDITISEITLGPGDEMELSIWRNPDLSGRYKVDASGKIFMPLAGVIEVRGISVFKLREKVIERLSKYLVNPQVNITITSYKSRKVYVLGELARPGIFQMSEGMNLIEAVLKAGGFTDDANPKSVLLIRGGLSKHDVKDIDVEAFLEGADITQNPVLHTGDIVYVPSSFIADVDRFFEHLSIILSTVVSAERAIILEPLVEDVLNHNEERKSTIVIEGR